MAFVPATVVQLCSVPIDSTQQNQLRFATRAAQTTYFASRARHSFTDFTFQRKDSIIRVPAHIDTLYDANYVMYQTEPGGGKWFYSFITKMEYENESVTLIYIETDVYQTWFLDCTLLDSFVEREHEEFE